ncbi:MAG: hypothetical protein M1821_000662 [Bathelium mastoideum]|nr:MAG: hypothetical protein M1821_000662 [Bathelium mastoideum]
MRLLKRIGVDQYCLTANLHEHDLPRYAILSHTWGQDIEEVAFEDVIQDRAKEKTGYGKLKFCAEQAAQDGLDHFWIDSCCINKSNATELSEAINSMFRWYGRAAKCYVYLSDVSVVDNDIQQPQHKWEAAFRASRWFTRGWTLQELLAPRSVEFYSCECKRLGDKESLKLQIQEITKIDVQALQGVRLSSFSIEDRIDWALRRTTKLEEDEAYSLLGIVDVSMTPLYGEGRKNAFRRLYSKIDGAATVDLMQPPPKRRKIESYVTHDDRNVPQPVSDNLLRALHLGMPSTSSPWGSHFASPLINEWEPSNHLDQLDAIGDKELQEICLKDLNVVEARSRAENVDPPFGNTYSWLFQSTVGFEDWLSGKIDNQVYWIRGKAGSGKSTLMKFVMQNHETRYFLSRYHRSNWTIAGFFFHDRGSLAQKSLSSMLREILFQVLRERCHLVRPLLKIHPSVLETLHSGQNASITIRWKQEDIEKALFSITSLEQLNLCLFIDALDEHEGNHRTLLAVIDKLQGLCNHRQFRLRLCLSSRPENIFQQEFQTCPGFVIHEWTKRDIMEYTEKRLQNIAANATIQFRQLLEEISNKARGVFLWVKLVVEELLEGSCNGNSISELMDMLSIMPPELEALYERALRRSTRFGPEIGRKYNRDAYIMFQIALCINAPLSLHDFLNIANYCSSGSVLEHDSTLSQKLRRLHGRCFGLLVADIASSDEFDVDGDVQFVHQTAKDIFTKGKGFDILLGGLDDKPVENGHTYILQYSVFAGSKNDPFLFPDLLSHANKAESASRNPSIQYIKRELQRKREPLESLMNRLVHASGFCRSLHNSLMGVGNHHLNLLVISICACLPVSVAECLKSLAHMPKRYAGIALRATIYDPSFYDIDDFNSIHEILEAMFKTGMDADSVFTNGETPFAALLNADTDCSDPYLEFNGAVLSDVDCRSQLLSTLVHYGADPNQMIGGFPSQGGFAPGIHLALTDPYAQELVSVLVSFGADVSLRDSEGFLALFYAIAFEERECVRILLWNNAQVCYLNAGGLCALVPTFEDFEDFGQNSLYMDFHRFQSRCHRFNDLFMEASIEHVESCKHS